MFKLKDLEYDFRKLNKIEREAHREQRVPLVRETIAMEQKIVLYENVIYDWTLKEGLEGICKLTFRFHRVKGMHNMLNRKSHYQVQRNAVGAPILVRVPE